MGEDQPPNLSAGSGRRKRFQQMTTSLSMRQVCGLLLNPVFWPQSEYVDCVWAIGGAWYRDSMCDAKQIPGKFCIFRGMDFTYTKALPELQGCLLWDKKYQVLTGLQYHMDAKGSLSSASWLPSVDITQWWENSIYSGERSRGVLKPWLRVCLACFITRHTCAPRWRHMCPVQFACEFYM